MGDDEEQTDAEVAAATSLAGDGPPEFIPSEKFDGAKDGYKFEVSRERAARSRAARAFSPAQRRPRLDLAARRHARPASHAPLVRRAAAQNGSEGVGYYRDNGSPPVVKTTSTDKTLGSFEVEDDSEDPDYGLIWALGNNFMGNSPNWYKQAVAGFLVLNIVVRFGLGKPAAAWCVLMEFIFTLAMATNCYPLQPGGFIVIQGYALGLAPASRLEYEVEHNIDILLLVIFMVACVHFLKNLLLWIFTNLLIKVRSKVLLSVGIMLVSAIMSAFMDALSVSAVLISVCSGVLGIYYQAVQKVALPTTDGVHHDTMEFELVPHTHHHHDSKPKQIDIVAEDQVNPLSEDGDGKGVPASPTGSELASPQPSYHATEHASGEVMMFPGAPMQDGPKVIEPEGSVANLHKQDIIEFREFLRSVLMHGAVGTAIGGCTTLVGEPQNLVIAKRLGWDFITFAQKMAPITIFVWPAGVLTCIACEAIPAGGLGYGSKMPDHVRKVLTEFVDDEYGKLHSMEKAELLVQGVAACFLVVALCAHLTEVGFVGLGVAIIVTTMNGECEEHDVAHAFLEAMPFVSLLVVFFGVVAIIEEQHIFHPIINGVLDLPIEHQPVALYLVNGFLSMVSDNVFVVRPGPTMTNDDDSNNRLLPLCLPLPLPLPLCLLLPCPSWCAHRGA